MNVIKFRTKKRISLINCLPANPGNTHFTVLLFEVNERGIFLTDIE